MTKTGSLKKIIIFAFSLLCLCSFMFVGCNEKTEQNAEINETKQLEHAISDAMICIDQLIALTDVRYTVLLSEATKYTTFTYITYSNRYRQQGGGGNTYLRYMKRDSSLSPSVGSASANNGTPDPNDACSYEKLNAYKADLKACKYIYYKGYLFDMLEGSCSKHNSTFYGYGPYKGDDGSGPYMSDEIFFFNSYADYLFGDPMSTITKLDDGTYRIDNYVGADNGERFGTLFTKISVIESLPA